MGSQQSTLTLTPQYQQLKKQSNRLLGILRYIINRNTKSSTLLKQYKFSNESDHTFIQSKLRQRKKFYLTQPNNSKYILNVHDIQSFKNNQICGINYHLFAFLQNFETDLQGIYNDRKIKRFKFQERQIYQLIYCLCCGLITLYDNNIKNYTVGMDSIIWCKQTQTYKILDMDLIQSVALHPYQEILNYINTSQGVYLSPQLMKNLKQKIPQPYFSPKYDVFTMGVLILQLCTFQQMDHFFNYDDYQIYYEGLYQTIEKITYSQQLKFILIDMLQQNEENRVGLVSLKQKIQSISQTIKGVKTRSISTGTNRCSSQRQKTLRQSLASGKQNKSSQKNLQKYKSIKTQSIIKNKFTTKKHYQIPIVEPITKTITNQSLDNYSQIHNNNNNICLPINIIQQKKKSENIKQAIKQVQKKIQESLKQFESINNPLNIYQNKQLQTPKMLNKNNKSSFLDSTPIRKIQALQQQSFINNNDHDQKKFAKIKLKTGQYYQGEIDIHHNFQGTGVLYYPQGKIRYSGTWKKNLFHGFGILNNHKPQKLGYYRQINYKNFSQNSRNNWTHFEGEFNEGQQQGFGKVYYINGDRFSGCFKKGLAEGYGTFYFKSGQIINGLWHANCLKC